MIIKRNIDKVSNEFKNGNIDSLRCITPNVVDNMLNYAVNKLDIIQVINDEVNMNRHVDAALPAFFICSLLSAKAKGLFAISDVPTAITCPQLIEKLGVNIKLNKDIMTEGNVRNFIDLFSKNVVIFDEEIDTELKERVKKNKKKKEENKLSEDKEQIRKELITQQKGQLWIDLFNNLSAKIAPRDDEPTTYILDCVKEPVTLANSNYELSTVITYEGKPMRGYKSGVLRRVTANGGIIEFIVQGTMSESDIALVEEKISKYHNLKPGDIIIFDRGFAKIEFVIALVERGLTVIVPLKKNMELYKECIKQVTDAKEGEWKKHPNAKRKGQQILELSDLKGIWVPKKDQAKKPEKMLENAIDFKAAVIRIDKNDEANKQVIESEIKANENNEETDILYEDNKYVYIVIVSTDTKMSASQIVRRYEQRPEIEEDFRQLKDMWQLCSFTSTKFNYVMCHIAIMFLAYNIFNMYKTTEEGEQYKNKSMRTVAKEDKKDKYEFYELNFMIICGEYFYVYRGIELLDLYASCDEQTRTELRPILSKFL